MAATDNAPNTSKCTGLNEYTSIFATRQKTTEDNRMFAGILSFFVGEGGGEERGGGGQAEDVREIRQINPSQTVMNL